VPLIHNKAKASQLLSFARPALTGLYIHLRSLPVFCSSISSLNVDDLPRTSRGLYTVISRRHSSLHLQPLDHLFSTNESPYEGRFFPGASLFGGSAYLWWSGAVKMKSIPSVRLPPLVNATARGLAWTSPSNKLCAFILTSKLVP
jgi:hypothetical protein